MYYKLDIVVPFSTCTRALTFLRQRPKALSKKEIEDRKKLRQGPRHSRKKNSKKEIGKRNFLKQRPRHSRKKKFRMQITFSNDILCECVCVCVCTNVNNNILCVLKISCVILSVIIGLFCLYTSLSFSLVSYVY